MELGENFPALRLISLCRGIFKRILEEVGGICSKVNRLGTCTESLRASAESFLAELRVRVIKILSY